MRPRGSVFTIVGLALFSAPALAQQIGGESPPSVFLEESCVDVEVGNTKTYDCLNGNLERQAKGVVPLFNMPPIDSRASDIHLGIANVPAVRQQYGKNFGNSVIPYRPPTPHYSSPIGGK